MAHRSFLAVALVGFGVLACGAGDGGTAVVPETSQPPDRNPNAPEPNADAPQSSSSAPAPNPNAPAPSGQAPGGGASGCSAACARVAQLPCVDPEPIDECVSGCQAFFVENPFCGPEFTAYVNCVAGGGFSCELDADGEQLSFGGCAAQLQGIIACTGEIDEQPDPPQDDCTTAGGCICGGDTCLACNCSLGASNETCLTICASS